MSEDDTNELPDKHPSYGCVEISRVTGRANLFASKVPHNHRIALRVKRAERSDTPGQSHHAKGRSVVEVHMTHDQFARLLSSVNIGNGVACTIQRLQGEMIPEPPSIDREQRYQDDVKEDLEGVREELEELHEQADEVLGGGGGYLSKGDREALLRKIRSVRQDVESNIPYMFELLRERVEEMVTEARTDVDEYVGMATDVLKGMAQNMEVIDTKAAAELLGFDDGSQ